MLVLSLFPCQQPTADRISSRFLHRPRSNPPTDQQHCDKEQTSSRTKRTSKRRRRTLDPARINFFCLSQVYGLDFGLGELASATICRVQSRATTADRHQPQPFLDKARQHSPSAMPSASQSSQQSFTMSQQSQTGRAASFNRGYNGGVDGPQIYSVCIPAICRRSASGREMACPRHFELSGSH